MIWIFWDVNTKLWETIVIVEDEHENEGEE